jgi:uncharacterized membrane protein YebE (DUF533 family)
MARLGRDVFIALAAIGWADGKLDEDEADAIVRAALDEGLSIDEIEEIEKSTRAPVSLEFLDRSFMGKDDRLFVYAMASWIARMDGEVTPEEVKALAELGDALGVPEKPRGFADAIALEIAQQPAGDRPHRYDLPKLRATISERLLEAQRLRAESR